MAKKGSLELSVNFIVVMIISILILGGGFILLAKGSAQWEKEYERLQEAHKAQIKAAMARSGELVMAYPNTVTIMQGEGATFTVGVNNGLGEDKEFYIFVKEAPSATPGNKLVFSRDSFNVKNTAAGFTPVRIISSEEKGDVSYVFNVCAYAGEAGTDCPGENMYGDLQKIIINVK